MIDIVDSSTCNSKWGGYITENMVCAGSVGGKGSCSGDSGGPLVCKQSDKWFQYGVVSFGHISTCASPTYPSVFADVEHLLPWIQQQTGGQYLLCTFVACYHHTGLKMEILLFQCIISKNEYIFELLIYIVSLPFDSATSLNGWIFYRLASFLFVVFLAIFHYTQMAKKHSTEMAKFIYC